MKKSTIIILAVVGALVVMQFIPLDRSNPPVTYNVKWDSVRTQAYFERACMDCHSNKTAWPWYSYVAPVSYLVYHDVDEGREDMNISSGVLKEAAKSAKEVREGEMPPGYYTFMHPKAKLTDQEKAEFIDGLGKTFGIDNSAEDKD